MAKPQGENDGNSMNDSPPPAKRARCDESGDVASPPESSHEECVNTIRVLCADTVQKAKSGHPGGPMGCAPMAHALWGYIMKFSPSNPEWINRDRFVLSNGHCCSLLYSMLHLTGYKLSMDDLKQFRQLHSKTPGHPENFCTDGVEVCTGPLGQGLSQAVGMAIAAKKMAVSYNKDGFELFNNRIYVICGDGCMMEGITSEASSLAGHLCLDNLTVLYDDNKITIDGPTNLAFSEDVGKRYESYGWHVAVVTEGNESDPTAILSAIEEGRKVGKPTFILVKTTIAYGSCNQGLSKTHGAPLGSDDIKNLKEKFNLSSEDFFVSEKVKDFYANRGKLGDEACIEWDKLFAEYAVTYPAEHAELTRRMKGELLSDWKSKLPTYKFEDKAKATRQYSAEVLGALQGIFPELVGGSADLTPSNLTKAGKELVDFQKDTLAGNYLRFGVREHAMSAICNGMYSFGGFIPFCATFLTFLGYSWGATRLSALSKFGIIYVCTHDSIDLGEDGPTHQPIEVLTLCRSTPNMLVIRPADGNETVGAYIAALENRHRPSVLAFSRSGTPNLVNSSAEKVLKGAYVLREVDEKTDKKIVTLIGTGTELKLCLAAEKLVADDEDLSSKCVVRTVSMPCWELFAEQSDEYKASVFPHGLSGRANRVYVEASHPQGFEKFADHAVCMSSFGTSAPSAVCMKHFKITAEEVLNKIKIIVN